MISDPLLGKELCGFGVPHSRGKCCSYTAAIESAKQKIAQDKLYLENWLRISLLIRDRKLLPGQSLALIHFDANQVLDENTDEEAYAWLDQMIYNVERDDKKVEKY